MERTATDAVGDSWPVPGSPGELEVFAELQDRLPDMYRRVFPRPSLPRTVVVVPSLTLDPEGLSQIEGVHHYEERMLCLLMLLRLPKTEVIYLTSTPLDPTIVDYYFDLLPAAPASHARQRLKLMSCKDASAAPLTEKILARPQMVEAIRAEIIEPQASHITCFNATALERTLAVKLGLPMYATDPRLAHLGSKSTSREIFRNVGVAVPDGFENLHDEQEVATGLADLRARNPDLRRAVVKLNDGFSGGGNAVWDYERSGTDLGTIRANLPVELQLVGYRQYERYVEALGAMGGIVEELIEGDIVRSPSVQCRINPVGELEIISTHDQVLDDRAHVFMGCSFPAAAEYQQEIHEAGIAVGKELLAMSALGRFSVDFVSAKRDGTWTHYALEVNLRKGGTTLPYLMLQFLTAGGYDLDTGQYRTSEGAVRSYYASDNVKRPDLVGCTPRDVIHRAVDEGLHFDVSSHTGVVFHLLGAVEDYGKLGMVCIGETKTHARQLFDEALMALAG